MNNGMYGSSGSGSGGVEGVMLALVTNNKDPDKLGRVKLKFPHREIDQETDWVRCLTFMGGKDRGSLFVPEVNDEVLVAFHMGDFNQPYVIGSLWNKTNPAPAGDENNNIRKIKSKSGHEFIFDDTSSSEKITLKTKKGSKLEFTDSGPEIKLSDDSGNHQLTITGGTSGKLTLKSSTTKVEIAASGDITISSSKEIAIKSTQIKLEATAALNLKGGATVDIKSDGIINIKGSMVKIN
ncbi:phage baseplate assembly protein V [Paenibacillus sp. R14(2021)]|uniref:phage baseplate assembly protein V n=1 Tax=Paenibacillus sp. R14(2021) TaxID=2859228 RepID=UPI001C6134C7|nr:phage baseplate assembly protein V [Paenibacillus sp. R14(2021)]